MDIHRNKTQKIDKEKEKNKICYLPPREMPVRITHSSVMSNNVQSFSWVSGRNYRRRAAAPNTAARPAPALATTDEAPPVKAGPSGPVGLTLVG